MGAVLKGEFGKETGAGEGYLNNRLSNPPEAVLTRRVQDLPVGTRLRFGKDKVEVIPPNEAAAPNLRPRFTFDALFAFACLICAPRSLTAAGGEPPRP